MRRRGGGEAWGISNKVPILPLLAGHSRTSWVTSYFHGWNWNLVILIFLDVFVIFN